MTDIGIESDQHPRLVATRVACIRRGMTMTQLAATLGVTPAYLYVVLRGPHRVDKRVTVQTRLAELLPEVVAEHPWTDTVDTGDAGGSDTSDTSDT